MCGIAGVLSDNPRDLEPVPAMVAALAHRGPDGEGFFREGPLFMGMRRLAINDVDGGKQPLTNEDGSISLVINGEIYNSPELRKELEARRHRFKTRTDGEVIVHLYEEKGTEFLRDLDGMFALALWNSRERTLLLARDIPGEKPLYIAELPGGGLAFASEIPALLRHPALPRDLNIQALWDLPTFLWVPEPATILQAVKTLPRGQGLVLGPGKRKRTFSFQLSSLPQDVPKAGDDAAWESLVRAEVESAVRSRLLSDVPVGAFLSSGLDSSIICTLASKVRPDLHTFTIAFEDVSDPHHGKANEAPEAEATAKALGTRHTTVKVEAGDFRRLLPDFVRRMGQPNAVSSGLGVLAVSEQARAHGVKVLLTGDGADEAFGGYSWYAHLEGDSESLVGASGASWQDIGMPESERARRVRALPGPRQQRAWHYYATLGVKSSLYSPMVSRQASISTRLMEDFKADTTWLPMDFLNHDRDFYFPFEMLVKADRMTMAMGVEGRVPFAAPRVQHLARQIPFSQLIRNGELKSVLRRAFANDLPPGVVNRSKHGFNVPIDHWLRGPWCDLIDRAFSLGSRLHTLELIHPQAHSHARALLADPLTLHGHSLLSFVMLELWLEEFSL
ncbi:MAG: asparagine synthase (glutamine-hydrolyzing) [Planctomycetota bacterium]